MYFDIICTKWTTLKEEEKDFLYPYSVKQELIHIAHRFYVYVERKPSGLFLRFNVKSEFTKVKFSHNRPVQAQRVLGS